MNTTDIVKRLSKALRWEITPLRMPGVCFVVKNAVYVGSVATMPETPEYVLVAYNANIIDDFDANDPSHLEIFMAFLNLTPPITTYISWDVIINHLEKNGVSEITLENVERAGFTI